MEETTQASPDIIQFIKERDAARDDMKKAQDELAASQSKLYDALQRIEALEKVKSFRSAFFIFLVCLDRRPMDELLGFQKHPRPSLFTILIWSKCVYL